MSALIKSVDARGYRSLATDIGAVEPDPVAPVAVHQREIATAHAQLATLQAAHADCPATTQAARVEGIEHGRELACAEFDHGRAEALDRLEVGCAQALERFSTNVIAVERLATLIAHNVLDKLLLGSTHYRDLSRNAIAAQVQEIDRSSIIGMLVSPVDFPDQAELDQLADLCGIDQATITQAANLEAGHCRIELTLGTLDVGLRQQWERLRLLFDADLGGVGRP